MTAAWVAGSVRAEAMARRRYGAAAARSLARASSLGEALDELVDTPFGHDVRVGQTLGQAQRAVAATALWHLRVLAGWAPWQGTQLLRVVAAGYEIANVDGLMRFLSDGGAPASYRLGELATSWPRLEHARSLTELRSLLATSPWGDPGQDTASAIQVGMRLALAHRAGGHLPSAWPLGGAALLVARERFAAGRQLVGPAARSARVLLGDAALVAASPAELAAAVPREAAWVLEGAEGPEDLWRAEAVWWRRVEQDGFRLLRSGRFEPSRLVGAAAVLCVDAWRVRAALEVAARGGSGLEVFDDVA